MKFLKNLLITAVTMIVVKGCFFVAGSMNHHETERNTAVAASRDASATAVSAIAGSAEDHTRYRIVDDVTIDVPSGFHVLGADSIKDIRKNAEIQTGDVGGKSTLLAANSDADTLLNSSMVRVSMLDTYLSEDELRNASQQDLRDACDEIKMRNPKCYVSRIGDRFAMVMDYSRDDGHGRGYWGVRITQIPYGNRTLMFTISFLHKDPNALNRANAMFSSISVP